MLKLDLCIKKYVILLHNFNYDKKLKNILFKLKKFEFVKIIHFLLIFFKNHFIYLFISLFWVAYFLGNEHDQKLDTELASLFTTWHQK